MSALAGAARLWQTFSRRHDLGTQVNALRSASTRRRRGYSSIKDSSTPWRYPTPGSPIRNGENCRSGIFESQQSTDICSLTPAETSCTTLTGMLSRVVVFNPIKSHGNTSPFPQIEMPWLNVSTHSSIRSHTSGKPKTDPPNLNFGTGNALWAFSCIAVLAITHQLWHCLRRSGGILL
ncbi:hypothetical protein BJ508DRAFT_45670 [Ascobolus immersus RN42]|uniref:Uncharacterized protein n=1 Tax=Ascobolus immersus RN42 TaxID=1160509 RepID=A0A3N4HVR6_ASCIM|nr:hypothetical protein BJ508DRAFT_45670 [Ascobolus immersus RN42]